MPKNRFYKFELIPLALIIVMLPLSTTPAQARYNDGWSEEQRNAFIACMGGLLIANFFGRYSTLPVKLAKYAAGCSLSATGAYVLSGNDANAKPQLLDETPDSAIGENMQKAPGFTDPALATQNKRSGSDTLQFD